MNLGFKHPRFNREIPDEKNDISKLFENLIDDKKNEELKIYVDRVFLRDGGCNMLRLEVNYSRRNNHIIKLLCTHRLNKLPIAFNNYILDFICISPPGLSKIVWSGRRWTPSINNRICKITLSTLIRYPRDYPFKPPKYVCVHVETNISNKLKTIKWLKVQTIRYNKCLGYDWSPAYSIKSEILGFIAFAKINDLMKKQINNFAEINYKIL